MRLASKFRFAFCALMMAAAAALSGPAYAGAQKTAIGKPVTLWVDQTTGQVFVRPGRGRLPLTLMGEIGTSTARRPPERDLEQQTRQLEATQQQLERRNAALTSQVATMKPAWQDYVDTWKNKVHIGGLFYADYGLYTHTGFGPQNLTQIEWPGPGNELYNSFDVTRTYLNFLFMPTHDWVLRITPNIYRTIGAPSANTRFGSVGALGSNLNGNMGLRIKYAYLQYKNLFSDVPSMKDDTVTFGSVANPLVGWEEELYNFRYVNLTPWNYLSLSSTQVGMSVQGPIKFNEKQYIDYDLGIFDNASFHALENTNTKEAMARVSLYPFGAQRRFQGLGITGFYNYGYGNTTPDEANIPSTLKGGNAHIVRLAALVHYSAKNWSIAGEYDYGRNAFSSGNLFSGSGPGDAFGFPTSYADWFGMAHAILDTGDSRQQGYDFFGHYHIPKTPLTLFGFWQQFEPNTRISLDPLDFQRWVVGVAYRYNEFLRFAVDSQNLMYYHSQFVFPAIPARGSVAIAKPVPRDTHVFMANVEFNF